MKVHQFIFLVKCIFLILLAGCCSYDVPVDPNRNFYEEVRSAARSLTRGIVRTDEQKHKIAVLPLESAETREDLYIMTDEVDYSKLRINRIYNRYVIDHPNFTIDEGKLVSAIINGIRDVVGSVNR